MKLFGLFLVSPSFRPLHQRLHTRLQSSGSESKSSPLAPIVWNSSINYTSVSFFEFTPNSLESIDSIVQTASQKLSSIGARGTLLVATEGYNGQFAIVSNLLPRFKECLSSIDIQLSKVELNIGKTSAYTEIDFPFKKLLVKKKNYILTDNYNVSLNLQSDYGREATPEEWHDLMSGDGIVIDCRNDYESDIGTFEGALPLNTKTFSESWDALDKLLDGVAADEPILTYCTGGIRCRKTNAYLTQKKGFKNVVSLKHGIIAYDRWAQNVSGVDSKFRGVNYIFDRSKLLRNEKGLVEDETNEH